MLNQTQKNPKAISVNAIMENKKLSKLVADALKSPPGSSSREKATAMLMSINRPRVDGQGGSPFTFPMADVGTQTSTPAMLGMGAPAQAQAPPPPVPSSVSVMEPPPSGDVSIMELPPPGEVTIMEPPPGKVMFPAAPAPRMVPTEPVPPVSLEEDVPMDFYKSWFAGLRPEEQTKWKPLYEALEAGIGPKTFAWQIMTDTEKLKTLLPGVPAEMLPTGASLARQVGDLEEAYKEEFNLEALASNVIRLQERGMTIEEDLEGYITSRDKYISHLDTMLDTARTSMTKMDMANPYINKQMTNYTNYLYILKGRQQKRYADFLSDGINYHNAELTRATNAYNTTYKNYESALERGVAVTEEDYNRMNTMLEEMYTNLDGAEKKMAEMGILNERWLQEQFESATLALEFSEGLTMSEANKTKSQKNYLTANPDATLADWKALSSEEKLRWLEGEEGEEGKSVEFYVLQIGSKNPTYYDKKTKTIKWASIPQDLRTAVLKRLQELKKQIEARKEGLPWYAQPSGLISGIPGVK